MTLEAIILLLVGFIAAHYAVAHFLITGKAA